MWTCVMIVGCLLAGQPDAAADTELDLQVRRLVRQLNATQLAEREAAEAALLELGPTILDLLPKADQDTPAEVTERVGRVRQKLQLAAAEAAARPSLITLHADAMPLSEVLAAIQEQSGNKIVDYRGQFGHEATDPPLSLDFDETPFWEALGAVLDQAELTMYPFGDSGEVCLVARLGTKPDGERVSCAGPFRFDPQRVIAVRDLHDPTSQSLRLVLAMSWEPRLRPISVKQKLSALTALDENGNPLAVADADIELEATTSSSASVELQLPFALPSRDVKRIARLDGRLDVMLPGKIETFRFGDLTTAKNVAQRIAGVTVTLEQVRQNGSIWEVRMRARFDEAGDALESYRGWILENEVFIEDSNGQSAPYDTMEITSQTENEIGIAYGFVLDEPPKQRTFVYRTPAVIMNVGIDYELSDILLP